MHDCQKFREDWIAGPVAVPDCDACRRFREEANDILMATSSTTHPLPEFSDDYWNGLEDRLRETLVKEKASRSVHAYWKWSSVAAAAVIVLAVAWGMTRPPIPAVARQIEVVDDHIQGLDPMVVAFLERSELFLRNFTKIDPAYVEDIDDSRAQAKQSLMEIAEQKELAGNFTPVRIALDEYENVLREIKNMDSNKELVDLQSRILSNGLIANLEAYQPQVELVTQR